LVERLENAPDIGLLRAPRTIAGTIREQHEFASHIRLFANALSKTLIIDASRLSRKG